MGQIYAITISLKIYTRYIYSMSYDVCITTTTTVVAVCCIIHKFISRDVLTGFVGTQGIIVIVTTTEKLHKQLTPDGRAYSTRKSSDMVCIWRSDFALGRLRLERKIENCERNLGRITPVHYLFYGLSEGEKQETYYIQKLG